MIKLVEYQATAIIHPLNQWEEDCLDNANPRISNSWSIQAFYLLKNIESVVPTAEPLTYDFLADADAQVEASAINGDPDKIKGFPDVWFALAFYMKRIQEGNTRDCYEFAHNFHKSVKTGFYGLQQVAIAAGTPLFMSPHTVGGRNIDVVTLNGGCKLRSGDFIADVSSLRDKKRWASVTKSILIRNGKSEDEAKRLAESLGDDIGNLLSKPVHPAIERAE